MYFLVDSEDTIVYFTSMNCDLIMRFFPLSLWKKSKSTQRDSILPLTSKSWIGYVLIASVLVSLMLCFLFASISLAFKIVYLQLFEFWLRDRQETNFCYFIFWINENENNSRCRCESLTLKEIESLVLGQIELKNELKQHCICLKILIKPAFVRAKSL